MWRGWRDVLTRLGFETAALDAKLLTQHGLGLDAVALAVREHEAVSEADAIAVAALLQRRMSGESVARIIGEREFYGLAFGLNAATLEPRPDTELLVDMALGAMPAGGRLLDLGTGTGCIPIAILANQSDAIGVAVDLSAEALVAAEANAARHGVTERIALRHGSWFEPLQSGERFDLIVSNPPYIASDIVETLAAEVRDFDPRLALDGGPDGLAPYRIIAQQAPAWLKPDGHVLLEIGYDQGAAVSALLLEAGFADVTVHRDLGGQDRVVWAQGLDAS
ncbi:peptide chain release factor N(5)-glutamine methyltransferase [Devosia sp. FKR38]|uniref:peptide chain release factor N(5)-glutamine methyltransferase n=1 Tax=Devosia sp. FKR38 TaxID=2562312 RepID=UPI0024A74E15|nr:peptide chain release factor N(5)-glutamine methyltransferase [Devosia sp. FKR38]